MSAARKLADRILCSIQTAIYIEGVPPSIDKLAGEFRISRTIVKQYLAQLADEGSIQVDKETHSIVVAP